MMHPDISEHIYDNRYNRTVAMIFGICVIFSLLCTPPCHAESKSEMIRRLRAESCIEDIVRTKIYSGYLEQIQININEMVKQAEMVSPQAMVLNQARNSDAILTNLVTALTNHNQSKQAICDHLGAMTGSATSGYAGMSESERIRRIRTDYCTDDRQNGESIRREIPTLKEAMEKMLNSNPAEETVNALIGQLQNQWAQLVPILDKLYDELILAKELCKAIEERVSKSERIRITREGLKSGGPTPYFLHLITY